uniref:Uncharacterized protein LOC112821403 isoform X2 n=1 Tax=Callorhinus ursinus TaxID=34884 RepID=A0A3Q7P238_CALUR|nr:uncharacterized protein LOC112821403 isoform X2 [Callorhinus ursinus]XP_025724474.1 uncharacterized protein LOC112821426 isoform X2 [Callorhinus ursinus]
MIVNTCPQILWVVSCKPCEAELRPPAAACPDLKVFPEGRCGPASQVALQTTETRSGQTRRSLLARPGLQRPAPPRSPCRMLTAAPKQYGFTLSNLEKRSKRDNVLRICLQQKEHTGCPMCGSPDIVLWNKFRPETKTEERRLQVPGRCRIDVPSVSSDYQMEIPYFTRD